MQCAAYWSQKLLCAVFLIVSMVAIVCAMVFMCLMVLAEFYLVLYDSCFHIAHGSLNSFDGFLMVLIVFSFNHSLILGDVGRF